MRDRVRHPFAALAAAVLCLVTSSTAVADVPPPHSCNEPGQPCFKAPPTFAAEGVCTKTKCSKPFPPRTEWDCNLCMTEDEARKVGGGSGCAGCHAVGSSAPAAPVMLLFALALACTWRRGLARE